MSENTNTVTKTTAKAKPKTRRRKRPEIGSDAMTALIVRIEELNATHTADLVAHMRDVNGLKLRSDRRTGVIVADMAGIKGAPGLNDRVALQNWANAARRARRQAGVQ